MKLNESCKARKFKPFAKSPQCQDLVASGAVSDFAHLPSYFAEQVTENSKDKQIQFSKRVEWPQI